MGKIRDLFKKIRDTKGTFHAKMGAIKYKNGMNMTEAGGTYSQEDYGLPSGHVQLSELDCKEGRALKN